MSIKIAVCDDDEIQLQNMRKLLTEWSGAVQITEYGSSEQFLFGYADNPCDLLLLDIEMDGMNGMELAKSLRAKGDMLPIIFITGFSEYIGDGYDVEALHYLLKPVDNKKLYQVLDRCAERHKTDNSIILPCGDGSVRVSSDDIVYLEAFGKKTQVTLNGGKELVCACGLSILAQKLGKGFISCHRSYIVNIGYISSISKTDVTMDSGKKIPLSRRSYDSVNRAFIDYYKEDRE